MFQINQLQAVDFSSFDLNRGNSISYGNRIGFVDPNHRGLLKTNPRNEIGKMGIACHSWLGSFFNNTIEAEVSDNAETKVVYLNKNSTVKWLNSQLPANLNVTSDTPSNEIVERINALSDILQQVEERKKEQALFEEKPTYTASLTTQQLDGFWDRIKTVFWRVFNAITTWSWNLLKFRFYLQLSEKTVDCASQLLAASTYRNTVDSVPAYKEFIGPGQKDFFNELPPTSKENYIKPAITNENEQSLYHGGKIPHKAKRDTSTGTSGPSTAWYRGVDEQHHVEKMSTFAAKAILGERPYSFINGFAMVLGQPE